MLTICQMKFSYDYELIKQKAMANLMKLFCMIHILLNLIIALHGLWQTVRRSMLF